jgi:flagellar hook-length control protein FliK
MVMSEEGVQSARLRLHPENLGSLDVRIQVEDDSARVWFTVQHGQTREALEAALPRLRDLFAEQGMQLVQADVESGRQDERAANAVEQRDDERPGRGQAEPDPVVEAVARMTTGLFGQRSLDIYV